MPRSPRLDFPGALHHVMARGIERCDIFRSETDRGEITGNGIRRELVRARAIVSYVAVRHYGFPLARVARTLNVSSQSVLRGIKAGPTVLAQQGWSAQTFAA